MLWYILLALYPVYTDNLMALLSNYNPTNIAKLDIANNDTVEIVEYATDPTIQVVYFCPYYKCFIDFHAYSSDGRLLFHSEGIFEEIFTITNLSTGNIRFIILNKSQRNIKLIFAIQREMDQYYHAQYNEYTGAMQRIAGDLYSVLQLSDLYNGATAYVYNNKIGMLTLVFSLLECFFVIGLSVMHLTILNRMISFKKLV